MSGSSSRRQRRRIAVVTGTRAEFGLLRSVMEAIAAHPRLELFTLITGMHLLTGTWREVIAAGFAPGAKVPMQRAGHDGRGADVQALARGIAGIGRVLAKAQPEVVLVLGDRIEALAAACAASVGGVHLAHLHGGDRAEGVADEAMRHAISKLAHLHFPATRQSRQRLLRMGEDPRWVQQVGSPALDALHTLEPQAGGPDLIVLQHPVGAAPAQEKRWMLETLAALEAFPQLQRLVLAPNHDPGHRGIRAALRQARVPVVEHLPRMQFLRCLLGAQAIVGNSSAGLIEAAALRVPCVNIGPRQAGREKPNHVIDCDYGRPAVQRALARALALPRAGLRHPYGTGRTGVCVADWLARLPLQQVPLRKQNTY